MGVGEAARRLGASLDHGGAQVTYLETGSVFRLDSQTKNLIRNNDVVVFAINPDLIAREMQRIRFARRFGLMTVAFWSWEFEDPPRPWILAAQLFDQIWSISEFSANAIRKVAGTKPVYVAPMLVPKKLTFSAPVSCNLDFDFLTATYFLTILDFNSDYHRKNPEAAILAFWTAFKFTDTSVNLVIKTTNGAKHPNKFRRLQALVSIDSRLKLITKEIPHDELLGLIAASTALISLHKSEGYGLNLADACALGTPQISSQYSGNLEFQRSQICYLIPGQLRSTRRPYSIYNLKTVEFEPDVSTAARVLVKLANEGRNWNRSTFGSDFVSTQRKLAIDQARKLIELLSAESYGSGKRTSSAMTELRLVLVFLILQVRYFLKNRSSRLFGHFFKKSMFSRSALTPPSNE